MRLRILVSLFAALSAYSAPSADFFIANGGQFDPKYRFSLQAREFDALFGTGGVDYVVKGKAAGSYRVVFAGARPGVVPEADGGAGPGILYALPHAAARPVHTTSTRRVRYRNLWPGIDLVYSLGEQALKYELEIAPGADARAAAFEFVNAMPWIGQAGELRIRVSSHELIDKRPVADQAGKTVAVRYQVTGRTVRFLTGAYDRTKPLRIDPSILIYTRLFGYGQANGVATDGSGQAYLTGRVEAALPVTPSTVGAQLKGGSFGDAFVAKLDPSGASFVYLVLLGGSGQDAGNSIAVDGVGNAYVTGTTSSPNFPTVNPYQSSLSGGSDGFIAKINPAGTLLAFSTFLGGSSGEELNGIALDAANNIYVTGTTNSSNYPKVGGFPSSGNGLSGDIVVTCMQAAGNGLLYSGVVGSFTSELGNGITVDASGSAYVAATTAAASLSAAPGFRTTTNGGGDGVVFKVAAGGGSIVYMNFLGGSNNDTARGVAVDATGVAYVTGDSSSSNFALVPAGSQLGPQGGSDVYLAIVAADGLTLTATSFLGGTNTETAGGIAVDTKGRIHVTGLTYSSVLFGNNRGRTDADAFHVLLRPNGKDILCSRTLGGTWNDGGRAVAVDSLGNSYVAGYGFPQQFTWAGNPDTMGTGGYFSVMVAKVSCSTECFGSATKDDWFWWPMTQVNNSNTITPELIAGRHADLGGATLPKFLPGAVGESVLMGASSTLAVPHHSSLDLGTDSFSIITWIRATPKGVDLFNSDDPLAVLNSVLGTGLGLGSTTKYEPVVSKMSSLGPNSGRGFHMSVGPYGPMLRLQNGFSGESSECNSPVYPYTHIKNGQWHQLAVVVERSASAGIRVREFMDGKLACAPYQFNSLANTALGTLNNTDPLRFGAPGAFSFYQGQKFLGSVGGEAIYWPYEISWEAFNGLIDDTMLFKRVISDEEVLSNYNSSARGVCTIPGCTGGDLSVSVRGAATLTVGGTGSVVVTVQNTGGAGTPAGHGLVYLSSDSRCQVLDGVAGQFVIPALAAGQTANVTVPITVAAGAGTRTLCAIADPNNQIVECSQENNIASGGTVAIALGCAAQPEFRISNLVARTVSTTAAGSVSYDVAVMNTGTSYSGTPPISIRVYLSTDTTLSANDLLVDTIAVSGAPSGTPPVWAFTGRTAGIPSTVTSARYYLIAFVDADRTVGECNENNNTAVTGQFWVLPRIAWPYGPRTPSFNFGPLAEPTLFSSEVTLDAATIGTAVCARVRVELEDDSMAADLHASLSGPVDFQTPAQQPPTGSRAAAVLTADKVNAEFKADGTGTVRVLTIPLRPNTPNQKLYLGLLVQSTGLPVRGKVTVEGCTERCQEAPTGLAAWWPLEDREDPVDVVGGVVLKETGSVAAVAGRVGQGRRFDGEGYLEAADRAALNLEENFSISLWYSADTLPTGEMTLLDKRARSAGYRLSIRDGRPGLLLGDGRGQEVYRATAVVPRNTDFHLLAVTADRLSGIRWYVDGVALGAVVPWSGGESTVKYIPGIEVGSTAPLRVGRALLTGDVPFRGRMDEILIAPRVLTAAEIRAMFSAGASGLCRPATGCVDYKVSGVTAPARAVMGVAGFRVQAFVENEGTLAAPASTLTVYLVREGSGERIVAGSIAVGALGPQQSLRVGASLPLFVAAGSYQAVVEAPLSGDCAPENNSVTVEEPMQVIAATAAGPDLLVASLGAVADTVVCNRLEVVATVANQGAAMRDAEGFRVGLYLSVDRVLTAADPLVGYCDMAPLGAGGVRRCSAGSLFIQTPGEYTLFARVDDRTSTTDVNRQNNVNSIPLSVKACPAP